MKPLVECHWVNSPIIIGQPEHCKCFFAKFLTPCWWGGHVVRFSVPAILPLAC